MSPDKTQWGEQFLGKLTPPKLSKSDEHFNSLGLEFVETREGIVLTELNDLFERVRGPRSKGLKAPSSPCTQQPSTGSAQYLLWEPFPCTLR